MKKIYHIITIIRYDKRRCLYQQILNRKTYGQKINDRAGKKARSPSRKVC